MKAEFHEFLALAGLVSGSILLGAIRDGKDIGGIEVGGAIIEAARLTVGGVDGIENEVSVCASVALCLDKGNALGIDNGEGDVEVKHCFCALTALFDRCCSSIDKVVSRPGPGWDVLGVFRVELIEVFLVVGLAKFDDANIVTSVSSGV